MRRVITAALAAGLVLAGSGSALASPHTQATLAFQHALAGDVPFANAPWFGTHNSFNYVGRRDPGLSTFDPNQRVSITEQLNAGARFLELDLHTFPSVRNGLRPDVLLCHGQGRDRMHFGCTIEGPAGPFFDEIAAWLRSHPGIVVLMQIQDELDDRASHDAAAADLDRAFGPLLHRPPAGEACTKLPLTLTRDAVAAAGAQLVIYSGCGEGSAWRSSVFDGTDRSEHRPRGFQDYPSCGPDLERAEYDAKLVRYFEDSTFVTATAAPVGLASTDDGITSETAARMVRCGVDLINFDQMLVEDPRLDALVWSWATGEPTSAGTCAVQLPDGRWEARECTERHPVACRAAGGEWRVMTGAAQAGSASRRCAARRLEHAAPRTGYESQQLRTAASGIAGPVWIGLRRDDAGEWRPLDRRS